MSLPPEFIEDIASLPGAKPLSQDPRSWSYMGFIYHQDDCRAYQRTLGTRGGWRRSARDNSDLNVLMAKAPLAPITPRRYHTLVCHIAESRFWDYLNMIILAYLALMLGVSAFQALVNQSWSDGYIGLACYLLVMATFAVMAARSYMHRRSPK